MALVGGRKVAQYAFAKFYSQENKTHDHPR